MHQTSTAMSEEDGLDDLGDIDDSSDEGAFFFSIQSSTRAIF